MPLVSVVVVSYRSRNVLPACLESLESCRRAVPLQVIVVDNDSRDGTVEWLADAWPDVRLVANQENRGFTRAVNQGLSLAEGEAVLLLNPDCRADPPGLLRLASALACDDGLAAVAPMLVDENGLPARSCGRFPTLWTLLCEHLHLASVFPRSSWLAGSKHPVHRLPSLDRVDWASGAALLLSRSAVREQGGLDEGLFMYMEEVDWCRRAARRGRFVRYVPEARFVHQGQHASRQVPEASYLHNLRSRVRYFRTHHGRLSAALAKLILAQSLALKWMVSRGDEDRAAIYARGLEAVWAA